MATQDRNIILGTTQEYRFENTNTLDNVQSRFIGLIVVPGQHITKIELESVDRTGIL